MTQNIAFRVPSVRTHYTESPSGARSYSNNSSSSEFIFRTTSGYTGKFPKTRPLPINAYSLNCQRITLQHNAVYKYTNGYGEVAYGPALSTILTGATYQPTFSFDNLYNEALTRLTEKLRGDLDISIDLAEAGKTARMLKLQDRVIDYSKTFVRRFGILKVASGAWLEYTYGIKPTLQTLYGVADENLRVVINKTARFSARAKGFYVPSKVYLNSIFGGMYIPVVKSDIKVSCTLGVDVRTDQFDPSRWSSLNPASIAWELMPYSFVIDWFFAVGGYLRNMETYLWNANKFRSGYKTTLSAGKSQCWLHDEGAGTGEIYHISDWRGTVYHTDIQRTILTSYPAPKLPSLNAKLGSSRLLSGAALLAQILGRR